MKTKWTLIIVVSAVMVCFPLNIPAAKTSYISSPLQESAIASSEWALADTPWPTYQHDFQRTGRSPHTGITNTPVIRWYGDSGSVSGLTLGISNTLFAKSNNTTVFDLDNHLALSSDWPGAGSCYSAPTHMDNGNIYYGGFGAFYALRSNGSGLWKYSSINTVIHATPVIDPDGIAYFVVDNTLIAADAAVGTPQWSRSMGALGGGSTPALGFDGTIYASSSQSYLTGFYAVNPDGSLKWSSSYGVRTIPAIADDGTIYAAMESLLTAFNPDGSIKWHFAFDEDTCYLVSPAIANDGTIYYGTARHGGSDIETNLYAINPDGTEKWRFTVFRAGWPRLCASPITDNQNNVYFCDDSGVCYALDADGNLLWEIFFESTPRTPPIIASDGIMYVGADDGVYELVDSSLIGSLGPPGPPPRAYFPLIMSSPSITIDIVVNSQNDETDTNIGDGICATNSGKCTLRAAVQEANASSTAKTISLPAGTYALAIEGNDEDSSLTGDLDITGNITLYGAGRDSTTIDASQLDRVFDVHRNGVFEIIGVTMINGNNVSRGGGIHNAGKVTLTDSAVNACEANSDGGGLFQIYWDDASFSLDNSLICDNSANGYGGGIDILRGTGIINNSTICRNSGGSGGGITADPNGSRPTLTINNSLVSHNHADYNGGGMSFNASARVTINHTTVSNNDTFGNGGGIVSPQVTTLKIAASTISNNTAGGNGGGLSVERETSLHNCTISGNQAGENGGGIYFDDYTAGTLINTTITGNVADSNQDDTGNGGGIARYEDNGTVILRNTIVAGNYDWSGQFGDEKPDCDGLLFSVGHNLIGNNYGCAGYFVNGAKNDLVGTESLPLIPLLGSLQDNGGETATHALLAGSPAIDAGGNSRCLKTDQRGVTRFQDGDNNGTAVCDIGAYEAEAE